ncbi:MAG: hypothetical protein O3C21_02230 [Verrucomicrobia bacterium]|nr:hypothetical protein [Verrucomicrobiota bacterium]
MSATLAAPEANAGGATTAATGGFEGANGKAAIAEPPAFDGANGAVDGEKGIGGALAL